MRRFFRKSLVAISLTALAACTQSPGDPCTFIRDANTVFGLPVKSTLNSPPGRSTACAWKSAEGRNCGSISVLGKGWTEVPDASRGYEQIVASMAKFGMVNKVDGVGDDAQAVDVGSDGVMLAFRKGTRAAMIVTACNGHSLSNGEFAKKLGSMVAAQL